VTSPLTSRLSRVLLACLLILALGVVAATPASAALPSAEQDFVTRINQERTSRSLKALTVCGGIVDVARAWSDKRAATSNHVGHNPSYTSQIPSGWTRAAENVAWGSGTSATVAVLHKSLMDSAGHRANILGDFTHIGVGVTVVSNQMYVTQNFGKYASGCGGATTSIALTVTKGTYDNGTKSKATLSWSGATGSNVDVWRNGAKLLTTANDGAHVDKFGVKLAAGTVRSYKVCRAGTTTCSPTRSVTF
jgi:uncharacterized protein YkwD